MVYKGLGFCYKLVNFSDLCSIVYQILSYFCHRNSALKKTTSFTRSYVKDTNHFLAKLGKLGSIPDGALLCTVDVVGLYPSIPPWGGSWGYDGSIRWES